jgi:hypothetical protein
VASELHRALLPCTCLDETHFPRRKPEKHLVAYTHLEPWIHLDVDREPDEKIHNIQGKEWMSRLFTVCRDYAIVPAEIARWDAIHLELELTVDMMSEFLKHSPGKSYLIYNGFPAACAVSGTMSAVPAKQFV